MITNKLSPLYFIGRQARTAAIGLVLAASAGLTTAAHAAGAVYTLTNAAAGNAVAVFNRADNGTLTAAGQVATNGLGTGTGLGNQGALVMSKNGKWMFAVNAGSNDISVFSTQNGLTLIGKTPSGGVLPVSVTTHDDLVYVLNGGGTNNITGFTIGEWGQLTPIAGSTKSLSAASTGPAQVEFSNDGEVLVVTEKATNKIDLYRVENGVANGPAVRDSVGATPFGFAFDKRDHLIVSEAFGGAAGKSALSSYNILEESAALQTVTPSAATTQTAACWVVVTKNGRYTYTTNTGSGNISGYRVDKDGRLTGLNANGITGVTGAGPTDLALSRNSKFLYALTPGNGSITAFGVAADGSLSNLGVVSGLPARGTGLIAR